MLKKVLLVSPGRHEHGHLTAEGIDDIRWLGQQILEGGGKPTMVFSSTTIPCLESSLILVGCMESVCSADRFCDNRKPASARESFYQGLRKNLRTDEDAIAYLGSLNPAVKKAEEIIMMSDDWGMVFPKVDEKKVGPEAFACWAHPIVWKLNMATQVLTLACEPRKRFGSV